MRDSVRTTPLRSLSSLHVGAPRRPWLHGYERVLWPKRRSREYRDDSGGHGPQRKSPRYSGHLQDGRERATSGNGVAQRSSRPGDCRDQVLHRAQTPRSVISRGLWPTSVCALIVGRLVRPAWLGLDWLRLDRPLLSAPGRSDGSDRRCRWSAGRWRLRFSHCLLFIPAEARSAAYNPLLEVRRGAHEVRDVQNIADTLVDLKGELERDNHWEKTSHALLIGAMLHILYAGEDKTLRGLANFLSGPAAPFVVALNRNQA